MSSISSATSARPQNLSFMGNGGWKEEEEVGRGSQKRLIDLELVERQERAPFT